MEDLAARFHWQLAQGFTALAVRAAGSTGVRVVGLSGGVMQNALLARLLPLLLAAHEPILGVPMDGYWCDIGTPRAYYRCSLDVLDGRLSPAQPDAPDDLPPQLPHADPNRRTVPCRDRAHLMRTVSEAMMEAGADFTDGLHLRDGGWELSIRPDANASALQVEANAPDAAAETARLLELMERDENQ